VSDYLSDEEQLARLKGWWSSYGVPLLVGLLVAVVAVAGWRWYQGSVEQRVLAASDLYTSYLTATADRQAALAEQIVDSGAGTAYPTFVLLAEADRAVNAGEVADAEALLRRAVAAASAVELADLARLRLARVLFDQNREDESLTELGAIRGSGYRSLAAELKGDIHLSRGERSLAHESYVAARSFVGAGEQRPVLEMKIADTADASDS
jgi:predicted negative regulator of RcsB-dependent stress response